LSHRGDPGADAASTRPSLPSTTPLLEQAFAQLPHPVWVVDDQARLIWWNEAWARNVGAIGVEPLPPVLEAWRTLARSGKGEGEVTLSLEPPSGGPRTFLARATALHDASGTLCGWVGTATEAAPVIEARRAAASTSDLLQAVIDHIPAAVYVKDLAGRMILTNRSALSYIGLPSDQVIGQSDAVWLEGEQLARVQQGDREVLERGRTIETEDEAGFDGTEARVFLSRKTPLRDRAGTLLGLVGTSVEITERRRVQRALADSEGQLRRVLDALFAFVGVTTPQGVLTMTNSAPLVAGGVTSADVLGRQFWEAPWWSYDPAVQATCREAIETAASGRTFRCDLVVRMAGDTRMTIDYQAAPLVDARGRVEAIVHSGVDVEARVRAERMRQTLIAELHHRVRNLFSTVLAIVKVGARGANDVASLEAALSSRIHALAQAYDLIQHERGDEDADLSAIVGRVIGPMVADRVTRQGVPMRVRREALTPIVLVLHELATNAIKHGALSRPEGAVSLGWADRGDRLVIEWRERGVTITPPPATTGNAGGYGTQLLTICVESQLGGRLRREWSAEGLVVEIDLPVRHFGL